MTCHRYFFSLFVATAAAGLCAAAAPATAPSAMNYVSDADSGSATVTGTSTLHDWTMTSRTIAGTAVIISGDSSVTAADLSIAVNSLKSTEGSGMDKKAYEALKSDKYPVIQYHLRSTQAESGASEAGPRRFNAAGDLTIAGVTRQVNLGLVLAGEQTGQRTLSTHVVLKMSDFGIEPPKAMLGMIKSGDVITVDVAWRLTPRPVEGGGQ